MFDLPFEIWDNIFHLAAEDDDKSRFDSLKRTHTMFVLSYHPRAIKPSIKPLILVCRLWRQIIIRSNDLYIMSIDTRSQGRSFQIYTNLLKVYSRWLKSSKGCDIDLALVHGISVGFYEAEANELSALLKLLLPYLSRVRTLVMMASHAEGLVALLPPNAVFPRLQCFALEETMAYETLQTPIYFPVITPNITHLFLHGRLLSSGYLSTISNLEALQIANLSLQSVKDTLSHFPKLDFVHLRFPEDKNQIENEPIVMPQKRYPRLLDAYFENGPWSEILDVLGRSSLQKLTIVQPNKPLLTGSVNTYHPDSLSLHNLKTLNLTMPLASTLDILPLCTKCPSLQVMTLVFNEEINLVIKTMGHSSLFPSLKQLVLQAHSYHVHIYVLSLFDAPNLISLELQMPVGYPASSKPRKATSDKGMKVYLPNLVELKLDSSTDQPQGSWLQNLIMPSLKKLSLLSYQIDHIVKEWDLSNSGLHIMLEGLEYFALRAKFHPLLMATVCQCMKNVTTLSLDINGKLTRSVKALGFLTERTTRQKKDVRGEVLLPCLSKLEILGWQDKTLIVDALKALVLRRKEEQVPLTRIEVAPSRRRVSLADQEWFKEHVEVFVFH